MHFTKLSIRCFCMIVSASLVFSTSVNAWTFDVKNDEFTGKTTYISKSKSAGFKNRIGQRRKASLAISCTGGKASISLVTNTYVDGGKLGIVGFKVDDQEPFSLSMGRFPNNYTDLGIINHGDFDVALSKLLSGKVILVRFVAKDRKVHTLKYKMNKFAASLQKFDPTCFAGQI